MSRGRKKKITYSSRETQVTVGLFFLLISIVFLIALFEDSGGNNLFTIARQFFGQSLVLATFASFNLAAYFLNIKYVFTKQLSIFAQIALTILYPTFLSSLLANEQLAREAAEKGLAGGRLGFIIAWDIFFDRPFANYTPHIVGAACIILLLLAISISLDDLGKFIAKAVRTIIDLIQLALNRQRFSDLAETTENTAAKLSEITGAKRFGDFQRPKDNIAKSMAADQSKSDEKPGKVSDINPIPRLSNTAGLPVNVTEAEIGEDGLFTEELSYPDWQLPPVSLLSPYQKKKLTEADAKRNSQIIEQTLASFNIDAKVVDVYVGPSVVQYALDIPLGIKVTKIAGLGENIALALGIAVNQIRIEPIPGTTYLGIEAPRSTRDMVAIKEITEHLLENKKLVLGATIGKDIAGTAILADIKKMPHLLIAGATGSGKSVLTNAFITSLLMTKTPDELRLILVDPKQVELQDYNGIPHLLTPVITDMTKVVNALKWCVQEMESRYTKFAEAKVRDIAGYNDKVGFAAVPYIVVVIDEMADMMLTADRNEAETAIVRLAQKARATGIHLILATQRPSVNVITGIIKANIPGRIGMSVTSSTDSRVILDQIGAESLLGNGDLLYKAPDKTKAERVQAPFISQEEVGRVVGFIKAQAPEVRYITSILESPTAAEGDMMGMGDVSGDDMFSQAVRIVVSTGKGSSSFLQRRLNIGFNRAARLLDEMEEAGVVGPPNGSKPRDVLIADADAFLASLKGGN